MFNQFCLTETTTSSRHVFFELEKVCSEELMSIKKMIEDELNKRQKILNEAMEYFNKSIRGKPWENSKDELSEI